LPEEVQCSENPAKFHGHEFRWRPACERHEIRPEGTRNSKRPSDTSTQRHLKSRLFKSLSAAALIVVVPGVNNLAVTVDHIIQRNRAVPCQSFKFQHAASCCVGSVEDIWKGHLVSLEIIQCDFTIIGGVDS